MSADARSGVRRFLDWFFRDRRTGEIVIGQWPNLPLWLFAGAALARWGLDASGFAVPGWLATALAIVAALSLAWWALDEILRGVNPWRRCLGAAVLALYVWSLAGHP